jgi:hypothetical protein
MYRDNDEEVIDAPSPAEGGGETDGAVRGTGRF